jgi:3-polyprenyl-4-hydroxybenzoate decarboxylase
MRTQPHSDTFVVNDHIGYVLDPSASRPGVSSHMGIDATVKVPERFGQYPPLSIASDDLLNRLEKEYGHTDFYKKIMGNSL